jgi:hypothetical protein
LGVEYSPRFSHSANCPMIPHGSAKTLLNDYSFKSAYLLKKYGVISHPAKVEI